MAITIEKTIIGGVEVKTILEDNDTFWVFWRDLIRLAEAFGCTYARSIKGREIKPGLSPTQIEAGVVRYKDLAHELGLDPKAENNAAYVVRENIIIPSLEACGFARKDADLFYKIICDSAYGFASLETFETFERKSPWLHRYNALYKQVLDIRGDLFDLSRRIEDLERGNKVSVNEPNGGESSTELLRTAKLLYAKGNELKKRGL